MQLLFVLIRKVVHDEVSNEDDRSNAAKYKS